MKLIARTVMALLCCAALFGLCACGDTDMTIKDNTSTMSLTQGSTTITMTFDQTFN